jgi:ATP-dependent RNA helicase TDRD9
MHGRVYRLVSKWFHEKHMEEQSMPKILQCPLENVVLKAKILDMGPPQGNLAFAMDTPNLSDITNTILILKEVGALLRTCNGKLIYTDGDLTFIGRVKDVKDVCAPGYSNIKIIRIHLQSFGGLHYHW